MALWMSLSVAILFVMPSWGQQKPQSPPARKQATSPGQRMSLSYVTLPTGSSNYTIAVGHAQLVAKKTDIELIVQPASGSVAIPGLVGSKEAMLGMGVAQTLFDAYKGVGEYQGKRHPFIRVLQSGHDMPFGILTHTGTGIKSISDLKGKRVSCNILTSNVGRHVGILELKAYGLDVKDVIALKSENNDTGVRDLIEGRTDATVCSLSGAKMEELATKLKPVLLPFDPSRIGVIQQGLPAVFATVSKKTGSIPAGIPIVGTPSILFAHQDLDEGTVYRLVKTLVESYEELRPIHRDFNDWTPKNAVKKLPIPYHPGAIKYYKEAGLWPAEMDQVQIELLK